MQTKRFACGLGLVILAATALTARADLPYGCGPIKVDAKLNWQFNVHFGPSHQHLGPWYAYFPDAQSPVQTRYGAAGGWGVQTPLRGAGPAVPPPAPTFSYGNFGVPPSYWYGGP